ncbi:MAG: CBU_0592 family membrane protein [Acidimicrobiia bacterium]
MDQLAQLVGAVIIIWAYLSAQRGIFPFDSVHFLAANTIGAVILAVVAAQGGQWGFLLLETVWAWVAGRGLRKAISQEREAKRAAAKPTSRFNRPDTRAARRRRKRNPLRKVD